VEALMPVSGESKRLQQPPQLTDLQRRFAHEYLVDLNATAAWARAGGSKKNANSIGWRTLQLPHVRAFVDELMREQEQLIDDHALMVRRITFDRALVDPGDALDEKGTPLPLKSMTPAARRAIKTYRVAYEDKVQQRDDGARIVERVPVMAEVTWHDSQPDRVLALKLAGKLRDKVELTGKDGKPLVVNFSMDLSRKDEA
jgi:phage terminase small subunit